MEAVTLTPEQVALRDASTAAWIATLQEQARNDQDPETRHNAQCILTHRSIRWVQA